MKKQMFIAVLFVLYGALFSFSQERIASENSQVDAGVEIRTLEDSGLPIEEWVQGCWKAVVTKEERYNEVKDYKLSADKIEEYLKYYGEKRTFYIKITEDYLQYQFPEDDNEFDTRHPYTIDDGFVDGIYVGDELLANIYNWSNTLHIEISDKFDRNGYHIELSRVADLGPNEESITGAEIETNVYAALLEESIITNLTDAKGENYDWLIGEWENINEDLGDWAKVVITPTTFKYVRNPNNQSVYEIETATEYPIAIQFEPGNSLRESGYLKLGEGGGSIICVDEECQQVYVIVGEYSDLYLNKDVIQEYGRCWKNVMWTYGEWKVSNIHQNQDYRIKITPFYYQKINANDPSASFATAKKEWYKPKWVEHKFMGYNACIGEFYLDFDQKLIYSTPGLNEKMCFEQTSKGTISKVIIWMILGLIALGVLWGIFILVKLFIRLIMLIIRKTIQAFKTTIEGFMQFSISCKKPIKNLVTNITDKPRKLTTTLWGIIVGLYILIFWDIFAGLLILLVFLIYAIGKKVVPTFIDIASESMLAKGLMWLLFGWVICRIFGVLIGLLVIISSIIYLVLRKFAPAVCEKINSSCEPVIVVIRAMWNKKWCKVATFVCLILLPLSMQMRQTTFFTLTPVGSAVQDYHIQSEIDELEHNDKPLSKRELLKKRSLELQQQMHEVMREMNNAADFNAHERARREFERLQREQYMLEREAEAMGVYALWLL